MKGFLPINKNNVKKLYAVGGMSILIDSAPVVWLLFLV
jgi:hypothetical protein